ncbi:hypothetical protein GCM10010517_74380 [Streptosporangium fragile]|uniref:CN hydrolase domain-containing protein n=1 Tax=Streptosporangium fragile TaxID=46186 RepID=A0ABN3WAA4_9ACTN
MSRPLPVTLAQAAPHPIGEGVTGFARDVEDLVARFPGSRLVVFPELHLHGTHARPDERDAELEASAEPLDGPRSKALAELAGDLKIWLVPGTVCERGTDGALYNTALALSPEGRIAAWYRKVFPWRPYEPYRPGDRFVVFDIPEAGRVGFAICYDVWFPEVTRHLAWMGAEVVVNPVMTTTSDRAQELVLVRANAIMNQVHVVSVNAAGPVGTGRSLVVDPEGRVRVEAGEAATVLTDVLDLDDVTRVRRYGTAGLNRVWAQFAETDAPLDLPLYRGRIDPSHWNTTGS